MDDLPDDLRDFIIARIDSIAQLEALLLLMENREQGWTAEAAAKRLYIPVQEAAQVLAALAEGGFLAQEGEAFRFSCRTPDLEDMVFRLGQTYRQRLVAVTNLVHSKPNRLHEFANAFRFRRDG